MISLLKTTAYYDIIFSEIIFNDANGIDIGLQLREKGVSSIIVFITCSTYYLAKGYYVNAFRYIIKPLIYNEFYEIMHDCYKKLYYSQEKIIIKTNNGDTVILFQDISIIESIVRKRKIYIKDSFILTWESMISLYKKLPNNFEYAQKSFIVNLEYVDFANSNYICMKNGMTINLSRNNNKMFIEKLHGFISYL